MTRWAPGGPGRPSPTGIRRSITTLPISLHCRWIFARMHYQTPDSRVGAGRQITPRLEQFAFGLRPSGTGLGLSSSEGDVSRPRATRYRQRRSRGTPAPATAFDPGLWPGSPLPTPGACGRTRFHNPVAPTPGGSPPAHPRLRSPRWGQERRSTPHPGMPRGQLRPPGRPGSGGRRRRAKAWGADGFRGFRIPVNVMAYLGSSRESSEAIRRYV
jgi:hypothetical protein